MPISRFNTVPLKHYLDNGFTVLVPNQRIRDAVLDDHAEHAASTSFYSPDVNAVDVWIKNHWHSLAGQGIAPFSSLRLLGSLEESSIWTDLIERNDPQNSLLNPQETATAAQHAYQLYRLWLDDGQGEPQAPPSTGTAEVHQFSRWSRLFMDTCQEQQIIALADATRMLVTAMLNDQIPIPGKLIVVNFYQPPPLYEKLFALLTAGRQERIILTTDANQQAATSAGLRHRYADPESEILACALWAKQTSEQQPLAHIGIIFGGQPTIQPVIDRIFKNILCPGTSVDLINDRPAVNGTLANPSLLSHRLVEVAIQLLGLGRPQLDTAEFCQLLQSRMLPGQQQELEARLQLELQLRRNLGSRCQLSQVLNLMGREDQPYHCPLLVRSLLTLANTVRAHRSESATTWARLFQQLLESLGWPGSVPAMEHQQHDLLRSWQTVLAEFSSYPPHTEKSDYSTALRRLRMLCQKASPAPEFDSSNPISLFSLQDAVGLNFSHVWMLGFDDNSQPAAAGPSPFIAHKQQRQAGIPGSHSELTLTLAQRAFSIVCAATSGEIHGSYHRQNGDELLRPSTLLAPFGDGDTSDKQSLPVLTRAADPAVESDNLTPESPVRLGVDEETRGGQSILSDQSSCPFRAFANHRLHCTTLDPFNNGLDPRARGTALHIALERLFSEFSGQQQLREASESMLAEQVSRSCEAAIDYLKARRPDLLTPRFQSVEKERLQTLLQRFVAIELQRTAYNIVDTETSLQWQQQPLNITLKLDRIDRLDNGSLAIIDYKTGKTVQSLTRLADERPENLQLPLYHAAATADRHEQVDAVVIAQINSDNVRFQGLGAADNFHKSVKSVESHKGFDQSWDELTASWKERLSALAGEFIEGEARVDPINGSRTCEHCHLQPLCRIREIKPGLDYVDDADGEGEDQ